MGEGGEGEGDEVGEGSTGSAEAGKRSASGRLNATEAAGKVMSFDMLSEVSNAAPPALKTAASIAAATSPIITTAPSPPPRGTANTNRLYYPKSDVTKPATRDASTQHNGNHAATMCDLAPASMYGTSSSLDARFTLEMETFNQADNNGMLSLEGGLLAAVVPKQIPRQQRKPLVNNFFGVADKEGGGTGAVSASAEAYLELLSRAKADAAAARAEVGRLLSVNQNRGSIQGNLVPKSSVFDNYDVENAGGGGISMSAAKVRANAMKKKSPAAKLEVSACGTSDSSASSASYQSFESDGSRITGSDGGKVEGEEGESEGGSLSLSASEGSAGGAAARGGTSEQTTVRSKSLGFDYTATTSLFGTKVKLPNDISAVADDDDDREETARRPASGAFAHPAVLGDAAEPAMQLNLRNITDPVLSLMTMQAMFRRQLITIKRNVAAAKATSMANNSMGWMGGPAVRAWVDTTTTANANAGANAGTKGSRENDENDENDENEASNVSSISGKSNLNAPGKRGGSKSKKERVSRKSSKKERGRKSRKRGIRYSEALMKVDPSLTKKEAKQLAKREGLK